MIEDTDAVERVALQVRSVIGPLVARTVAPPILQPAGLYLELVGEEIRRSAVLTHNEALCLRPDMTIPAARLALAIGDWRSGGFAFGYDGRVFRVEQAGAAPSEARHTGLEWFAPCASSAQVDVEVLGAALAACKAAGAAARLVLGCAALRATLIAAVNLPEAAARRAARLGFPPTAQAGGATPDQPEEVSAFADALLALPPERAGDAVEGVLRQAGIAVVGGRSPSEIAGRLRAKAAARNARIDPAAAELLTKAFKVDAEPDEAFKALTGIAEGFAQPDAIRQRLAELVALWRAVRANAPAQTRFCVGFQPAFEYYDGLLFSLRGAHSGVWLGGGGRYDRVLAALRSTEPGGNRPAELPWGAAGFSLAPAALAQEHGAGEAAA